MAGGWLGWDSELGGRCSEVTWRLLLEAWPWRFKVILIAEFDTRQKFLPSQSNRHLWEVFNLHRGVQPLVLLQSQIDGQGLLQGVVGTSYHQAIIWICIFCFCKLLPFDPKLILSFYWLMYYRMILSICFLFLLLHDKREPCVCKGKKAVNIYCYGMVSAGWLSRSRTWFTMGLICGYCSQ